jgi:hypothetical protein
MQHQGCVSPPHLLSSIFVRLTHIRPHQHVRILGQLHASCIIRLATAAVHVADCDVDHLLEAGIQGCAECFTLFSSYISMIRQALASTPHITCIRLCMYNATHLGKGFHMLSRLLIQGLY